MDEKLIKDAQYRKGLSIAFFNATNSAISLLTPLIKDWDDLNKAIKYIPDMRSHFLEEHKKYYTEVIANIGKNYKVEESIKKLESAKTLEELRSNWLLLSEDERRDGDIIKVAKKLKKEFNEKV